MTTAVLVASPMVMRQLRSGRIEVQSETVLGVAYLVTLGDHPDCTCPSFTYRKPQPCKHIEQATHRFGTFSTRPELLPSPAPRRSRASDLYADEL